MSNSRYFIAKYISDLRRGEPRNIGVVLWTPAGVGGRFIAEKPERDGEVDGRSIPSFVTSSTAYKQWIEFWRGEMEKNEIESLIDPARKSGRSDSAWLDVLATSSKGNFVLAEGGFLLDPVSDIDDALDFLFTTLVTEGVQEETRDVTLDEVCDHLLEQTNLLDNPNFHSRFTVPCTIAPDIVETFEFSHAYHNGSIKRLYQRVPLSRQRSVQRKTVHDTAWMFDRVTQSQIVAKENAVSLVFVPDGQSHDTTVSRWLGVLGSVSRVVNVGDERRAREEFVELAALAEHH